MIQQDVEVIQQDVEPVYRVLVWKSVLGKDWCVAVAYGGVIVSAPEYFRTWEAAMTEALRLAKQL